MNKLLILFTILASNAANAWTIKDLGNYKFEALNEQVYVMHGPLDVPNVENQGFMNNPGIIIGDTGVVIVDPGSTYQVGKKVIEEIRKITNKPIVAAFNTHVHGDHWLGNQAIVEAYPNVKIYAHPQMIIEAKDGEGEHWVEVMNNSTKGLSKGTIATYPTDATSHLQLVNIGSEQFKIHSPTVKAHTTTDIMIEHVNSKTLFLGDNDLIKRFGRFDNTSDMHGNIQVLKYATNLNMNHYVPGHGPSGDADHAVKPFLDYLLIIQNESEKGYEEGLADYEIKPIALKQLDAYTDWSDFNEQLGKHINKMLLEVEELDL